MAFAAMPPAYGATGTTVNGRILDVRGNLPVAGATINLERGSTVVATTTTASDGSFSFPGVTPGVYTVLISASGYQTSLSDNIYVLGNESTVSVQTAIQRAGPGTLRTIASVRVGGSSSLQTSATINQHIDASLLQSQNYMRSGDALASLPFVNGSTSSSIGDDLALSIRGYDPTETSTLIDGHPVGPIGAYGQGFDFQLSPFWGLSGMNVVYGSGATGLYGVPTIAGSIDFQTITPTREPHYQFTQGVGNNGKAMTGLMTTGTAGRLGYALAYGVEGTQGNLVGSPTEWNLLTDPSNCNPNSPDAGIPSVRNADVLTCSYPVSGNYLLRNTVAKLTYDFGPTTNLLLGFYNETMNADSTGNGDTDYVPYASNAYNNPTAPATNTQTLPNGPTVTCNNSYVVLTDTPAGYQCYSAQQYNQRFSGPAGGGIGRYHAALQDDYHARITQQAGPTTLVFDGYVDNYNFTNVKGPGTAHHYDDIYFTHGFLVSDDYARGKNDLSAGVFLEHQQHTGMDVGKGTVNPDLQLSTSNYFLRDSYTPNERFSAFADVDIQRFHEDSSTFVNPRLSFIYRPTTNDVVRITGGRSSSVPDPSIVEGGLQWGAPQSYNPTCGAELDSIGSGNNPALQPESSDDYEIALGHRFARQTIVQANFYDSNLTNPIVGGVFPLSTVPAGQLPDLTGFLARLHTKCPNLGVSHFGVSDMFNAGSGRFKGFDISTRAGFARNFEIDGDYAVQSAVYNGMDDNILVNNVYLINGAQVWGIPLHRYNIGVGYENPTGFTTRMDGFYIGTPNGFNRAAYWYANFSIGQTYPAGVTINFGVNNIFNSAASQYGYIGFGQTRPQNSFGDPNPTALGEGIEEFGLPYRQVWLTVTQKL
jgi:outer membrane receptor protein involved in Fe transport